MVDKRTTPPCPPRRPAPETTAGSRRSQDGPGDATLARIRRFLDTRLPATPCLVVDLPTVADRLAQLVAELPSVENFYAVKANPTPEVVRLLAGLGVSFDVASPAEIDLCLAEGARPESISYGNTIKKWADVAYAYGCGVRLFVTDSLPDLENIAAAAPGSSVFCRLMVDDAESRTPFGKKFGCDPATAIDLLRTAERLGLDPCGVSFHVGSQQLDPAAWELGIARAAQVAETLAAQGIRLTMLNLGGGLPARYTEQIPSLADYASTIRSAVERHFSPATSPLRLIAEPGRFLVSDAGLIRSEVVLVSERSTPEPTRWVYLDIGRYNGLAETEGEMITYRLGTSRDGEPVGPVVIAGPTCDGDDVLYQRNRYELPLGLRAGDLVDILSSGAYTASYSSVAFNGFGPLPTYCLGAAGHPEAG